MHGVAVDRPALLERSARLETTDIDFASFADRPLGEETLRCLRYMHDVEGHTACYLRDVLVTRAHQDPDITAFLACWNYEEHWHGEALARVLTQHGETAGAKRLASVRRRRARREALRPMLFLFGSALTRHFLAVQMAWGAVNEWSTQTGYARLAARADHPVLTELLRRIMRQEGRHIDFYSAEAKRLLATSRRARGLTRHALSHLWTPVGSGVMAPTEVRFLIAYLFAGADGMAAAQRIDRQIDRLPGLSGLHLLERVVESSVACVASEKFQNLLSC
jgi:hypothetical protein